MRNVGDLHSTLFSAFFNGVLDVFADPRHARHPAPKSRPQAGPLRRQSARSRVQSPCPAPTGRRADYHLTIDRLLRVDAVIGVLPGPSHRALLRRRFGPHLRHARIACLDIRDDYEFMYEGLLRLLEARMTPHLSLRRPA
jgi:predicted protein tyrosine phosphatase